MKKSIIISIFVVFFILAFAIPTPATAAVATCQCVAYVENYFGTTDNIGNAYQTGSWFLSHGFTKVAKPKPGDVAVFQPGFAGAGANAGHVGIIISITDSGNLRTLSLRGANQGGTSPFTTELGCSNVRNTNFGPYSITTTKVAYYRIYAYTISSAVTQTDTPNSYFTFDGGANTYNLIGRPLVTGNLKQVFFAIPYGNGFRIIPLTKQKDQPRKCVKPLSIANRAIISQRPCGSAGDLWKISIYDSSNPNIGTEPVSIRSFQNRNLGADLNGSSLASGTSINLITYTATLNQKWVFTPVKYKP